ncbi:MAG: hypothetical protein K5778_09870 [Bacteroidaceae bacterium]|nr:hypothetical protein [Bacteroidaceae bacterium]
MKKKYIMPATRKAVTRMNTYMQNISNVSGNTGGGTGIGGGGDDSGGEHDPDAKHRGGIDGYGDLW